MNFTKYKLLNILIWLHEYLHILAISFVTDLRIKDLTIKIISNEKFAVSYKNNGDEVDTNDIYGLFNKLFALLFPQILTLFSFIVILFITLFIMITFDMSFYNISFIDYMFIGCFISPLAFFIFWHITSSSHDIRDSLLHCLVSFLQMCDKILNLNIKIFNNKCEVCGKIYGSDIIPYCDKCFNNVCIHCLIENDLKNNNIEIDEHRFDFTCPDLVLLYKKDLTMNSNINPIFYPLCQKQ